MLNIYQNILMTYMLYIGVHVNIPEVQLEQQTKLNSKQNPYEYVIMKLTIIAHSIKVVCSSII